MDEHKQAASIDTRDQCVHGQRQKVGNAVCLNFFAFVHVSEASQKPVCTAIAVKLLLFFFPPTYI